MNDRHAEEERRKDEVERACRQPGGFGTVEISDKERRLLERVKLVAIPRRGIDVPTRARSAWDLAEMVTSRTDEPPQDFDDG